MSSKAAIFYLPIFLCTIIDYYGRFTNNKFATMNFTEIEDNLAQKGIKFQDYLDAFNLRYGDIPTRTGIRYDAINTPTVTPDTCEVSIPIETLLNRTENECTMHSGQS